MSVRRFILLLAFIGISALLFGYSEATSIPIVRSARVTVVSWPTGQPPLRLLLISDIHVAGPDMPPERLARIVGQINELAPDIVLIAGDFISDKHLTTRKYTDREALAPLRKVQARLGVIAVLGNHDHWRNASSMRSELERAGVRLLANDAVRAGPLVIGGVDDSFTGHARPMLAVDRMRQLGGTKVLLSHSPDPFAQLPPDAGLMLAGHTHCGQIVLPVIGPLATMSEYGRRYRCGLIREGKKTIFVTAGLGTSIVPIRIGAPPDMWLLHLQGKGGNRNAAPSSGLSH